MGKRRFNSDKSSVQHHCAAATAPKVDFESVYSVVIRTWISHHGKKDHRWESPQSGLTQQPLELFRCIDTMLTVLLTVSFRWPVPSVCLVMEWVYQHQDQGPPLKLTCTWNSVQPPRIGIVTCLDSLLTQFSIWFSCLVTIMAVQFQELCLELSSWSMPELGLYHHQSWLATEPGISWSKNLLLRNRNRKLYWPRPPHILMVWWVSADLGTHRCFGLHP